MEVYYLNVPGIDYNTDSDNDGDINDGHFFFPYGYEGGQEFEKMFLNLSKDEEINVHYGANLNENLVKDDYLGQISDARKYHGKWSAIDATFGAASLGYAVTEFVALAGIFGIFDAFVGTVGAVSLYRSVNHAKAAWKGGYAKNANFVVDDTMTKIEDIMNNIPDYHSDADVIQAYSDAAKVAKDAGLTKVAKLYQTVPDTLKVIGDFVDKIFGNDEDEERNDA